MLFVWDFIEELRSYRLKVGSSPKGKKKRRRDKTALTIEDSGRGAVSYMMEKHAAGGMVWWWW
jgi:hypothetical protein